MEKQRIAILASGSGSNAEQIIRHFSRSDLAEVVWVGCNRPEPKAGVYARTRALGIETTSFNAQQLKGGSVLEMLSESNVDWVVLAGFLLKIPTEIVAHFQSRMTNIHPALLPDFGGKGMYGEHVHHAVKSSECLETGMTIHWVTPEYDKGSVIFQAACSIEQSDDVDDIAAKVTQLEHEYYARIIEALIDDASAQNSLTDG